MVSMSQSGKLTCLDDKASRCKLHPPLDKLSTGPRSYQLSFSRLFFATTDRLNSEIDQTPTPGWRRERGDPPYRRRRMGAQGGSVHHHTPPSSYPLLTTLYINQAVLFRSSQAPSQTFSKPDSSLDSTMGFHDPHLRSSRLSIRRPT
jgi:hypothetical protein